MILPNNKIEINFISDKIPSFYIYLLEKGFFSALPVSKNIEFFKNLKDLQDNLNQRKIKTLVELQDFIENRFLNQMMQTEKTTYISEFQTQFRVYNQFYDKHKEKADTYVQALYETQKSYTDRLKKIYHFLGIKENFKCYGIVTPVPVKSCDGAASPSGFYILFSPDKKKNEVYVGDSLLPERKQYTPLHEAGHVLYSISSSRRNFLEQKGLGARKLILTLSQYFFEYPEERKDKNMMPAWNALQCVDEAMAVFSASVSTDKVGYYGWEAADILSKQLYPIASRYLRDNKPLDDNLYNELAVSFERCIYQKNVQKLISHSQAER